MIKMAGNGSRGHTNTTKKDNANMAEWQMH